MKNFLLAVLVIIGFAMFISEGMIASVTGTSLSFWFAVVVILGGMVVIGCWDLPASTANKIGWAMMIVVAAFCLYGSLTRIGGNGGLLKPAFCLLLGAIGALGIVKGDKGSAHGH